MFRPARWARRRPVAAVLTLTALALLLRLVALGDRTVHWDEARVAYWTLRYVRGAGFAYRPIIHGPFVPLVVAPLFERFGPTAFAARLPVAIIGGLAPLSALLFRQPGESAGVATDRLPRLGLSDAETVVLAALLAGTPSLVYYSRFMRSDVPLAVFAVDDVLVDELERALQRGVSVYMLLPPSFIEAVPSDVGEAYQRRLQQYDNYHYRTSDEVTSTFELVDDAEVCLEVPHPLGGSTFAVIDLKDPEFAEEIYEEFEPRWQRARKITGE